MLHLMYWSALIVSYLMTRSTIVRHTEHTEIRLDPRGLVRHDILRIKAILPALQYKRGDTLESVAYKQGQHDILTVLENRLIGDHTNGMVKRPIMERPT